MKDFKKILFPVDLSESSEKILPYVREVAKKFDAKKRVDAPPYESGLVVNCDYITEPQRAAEIVVRVYSEKFEF